MMGSPTGIYWVAAAHVKYSTKRVSTPIPTAPLFRNTGGIHSSSAVSSANKVPFPCSMVHGTVEILGGAGLCLGTVLCIVRCVATPPAPTPQIDASSSLRIVMTPNDSRHCQMGPDRRSAVFGTNGEGNPGGTQWVHSCDVSVISPRA